MSSRTTGWNNMEATPVDDAINIKEEPDKTTWQKMFGFFIQLSTFFLKSRSDPILEPNRKLRPGVWGAPIGRYLRIYGDELFLYSSLVVMYIVWIIANFGQNALYAQNRTLSILFTAILVILITEQWKALPHRWLSRRVEKKQTIKMSTVTWVMSVSTALPGSIFDLRSKKLFILPLVILFTHGPDLFAGTLTQVHKSGANGILTRKDYNLGPVAGGIIDGGPKFFQSGLKLLSRDTPAEDELVMQFKRGTGTAYVPHMPQELYTDSVGLSYIRASDMPVYRVRKLGNAAKFGLNSSSEVECRNSVENDSPFLKMGAYTKGNCINMGIEYNKGSNGRTESFSEEIEVCRGTASVQLERTEDGPKVRKVSSYAAGDEIGNVERIQDGTHASCDGFLNIMSFGVDDGRADVQSIRLAVAWLVRSATTRSTTGYLAEGFEKGPAVGTFSNLRYKLPNWLDWIVLGVGLLTLVSQAAYVLGHPSALPRGFDTAAIHCGRVLSEHTTRCATRDWKFRSGQTDSSDDFTVQFGMVSGPDSDPHKPSATPTKLENTDTVVGAVHLEWGLPGEVVPVGFLSAKTPKRFNPAYVGASSKYKMNGPIEIEKPKEYTLTEDDKKGNDISASNSKVMNEELYNCPNFLCMYMCESIYQFIKILGSAMEDFLISFCPPDVEDD